MKTGILTVFLSVTVAFSAVQAKTMFVKDICTINVRVQPGEKYKIIDMLASDEKVETMETHEQWVKISFKGGLEGWVLKQFLTAEKPREINIAELETQVQEQVARITELDRENLALKQEKLAYEDTLNTLTVENQRLKQEPYRIMLLLAGGGIFLIGCITTLILQNIGGRKKSRGGLSFDKGMGF